MNLSYILGKWNETKSPNRQYIRWAKRKMETEHQKWSTATITCTLKKKKKASREEPSQHSLLPCSPLAQKPFEYVEGFAQFSTEYVSVQVLPMLEAILVLR
jgi:hypothetical protein